MGNSSGRMGIAEGIGLTSIMTLPQVFLATPATMIQEAGSLAWAAPLIGGFAALLMICLLSHVFIRHPGDLLSVTEKLLGKLIAYLVGAFCFVMLLAFSVVWTREFAEDTMLTALQSAEFDIITTCFVVSAGVIMFAGIESICRAVYIILPFIILSLLFLLVVLIPVYKLDYLFPWQGNGLSFLIKPALTEIGMGGTIFVLPLLLESFQNTRTIKAAVVFGYGLTSIIRSVSMAAFMMAFSVAVAMEKAMPFYEMARLIYLNRYLQRFESLFIIIWVITGVFAIALSLYGAMAIGAKIFKLPSIKPLIWPMVIIVAQAAALPPDTHSILTLEATLYPYVFAPGVIIITTMLFIACVIKKEEKTCRHV